MSGPDRFEEYAAKETRYKQLRAEILPHNKTVLFDALEAAGIACVVLEFDGYGDDGQFQGAIAYRTDVEPGTDDGVEVPSARVALKIADFHTGDISEQTQPLREAIEEIVSDFLEQTHGGWEDGEGAFGNFRLTVADRAIRLEYNERYVETTYTEHSF